MIYISVLHTTWTPRVGSIKFQTWLAHRYVEEVQRAIDEETYKARWRSLSSRYKAWKQRNHLSAKMWESTGELRNRISVKFGLVIGFKGFAKHSGTNLTCLQLARTLEYGTSKIPPRPLFRTVFIEMNENIEQWYKLYLEEQQ